jgi:hypothetical protein
VIGLAPLLLGWRKGGVKRAQRSLSSRILTLTSQVTYASPSGKPLPIGVQESGAILTCHVRDKLGIALEQHLGGSVTQLLRDPFGIFPGVRHETSSTGSWSISEGPIPRMLRA